LNIPRGFDSLFRPDLNSGTGFVGVFDRQIQNIGESFKEIASEVTRCFDPISGTVSLDKNCVTAIRSDSVNVGHHVFSLAQRDLGFSLTTRQVDRDMRRVL
jgi:hypothetical protein